MFGSRRILAAIAVQWLCMAGGGCEAGDHFLFGGLAKPRGDYCALGQLGCPDGQFCNIAQNRCEAGECSAQEQVGCRSADAALCQQGHCLPCQSHADCARWTHNYGMATPKEVCDQGACRPCTANAECSSSVCRTADLAGPQQGQVVGSCVASSELSYVQNGASALSCSERTGARDAPYCEVQDAIAAGKSFVLLLPGARDYAGFDVRASSITLVGPGRDAVPGAQLGTINVPPGGQLVLTDARVAAAAGMSAVQCASGSVTVRRATIRSRDLTVRAARGIDAHVCGQVTVEESWVDGFDGSGLYIERSPYRLVNVAVTRSGNAGEPFGVWLGAGASGEFRFNTVVANGRGLSCSGANAIEASIVSDNLGTSAEQIQGTCQLSSVATRAFELSASDKVQVTPDLLKLQRSLTLHQQCCIDKVDLSTWGRTPAQDYFGRMRPRGSSADIGFFEAD